jgi:hypothetical protein
MPATKTQRPPRAIIPVSLRADVVSALHDLATRDDLPESILIRRAVSRLLHEARVPERGTEGQAGPRLGEGGR